ncbi:MAG: permease, partial [Pirellulaceae bacterium]
VIQTTPYIGHPAYKFMGGRAAYVLATAAFVGGAGVVGYFSFLFQVIPEAAVLPILVFIGVEITAQSFHATPRRHYMALAIACLPALAKLVIIYLDQFVDYSSLRPDQEVTILSLRMLAGGFIITSLIWASAMAKIVDRRFFGASLYFAVGGILSLFGIMHSPWQGDKMFWPWNIGEIPGSTEIDPFVQQAIYEFSFAYLVMAMLMFALGWIMKPDPIDSDEEYEALDGH